MPELTGEPDRWVFGVQLPKSGMVCISKCQYAWSLNCLPLGEAVDVVFCCQVKDVAGLEANIGWSVDYHINMGTVKLGGADEWDELRAGIAEIVLEVADEML